MAIDKDDHRFDVIQSLSDEHSVAIGVGAPTRRREGICISLILFQPEERRRVYSKMHLHSSEEPYFVAGANSANFLCDDPKIALAICYELSVPEHTAAAVENGAEVHVASVADCDEDIDRVLARVGDIAREHSMTALFSNHVGVCNRKATAGKTSVWNEEGALLGQLDNVTEGVIVVDADSLRVATLQA